MALIVSIAMVVDQVLRGNLNRYLAGGVVVGLAALLASGTLLSRFGDRYLRITEEERIAYEYPLAHWLMMTLNPDEQGGYNTADDAFTRSFATYDERREADVAELRRRVGVLGPVGLLRHVLITKNARMWSDPLLAGSSYTSRGPLDATRLASRLLSHEGDLNRFLLVHAIPVHLCLLLGLVLASGSLFAMGKTDVHVPVIALMGVFLFFLAWECNARYLYVFSPVFLLAGFDGWHSLYSVCRHR